jgi:hypothetical protein
MTDGVRVYCADCDETHMIDPDADGDETVTDPSGDETADENTIETDETPDAGDDFRTGLSADVPVLMIQGDLDRSTPIENARHIHEELPTSHLLHVENGTHMAIREVRQFHPELTKQVREFLQSGSFGELPPHVTLPRHVDVGRGDAPPDVGRRRNAGAHVRGRRQSATGSGEVGGARSW